ncbi:MAG: hypothetical protein VX327_01005, partial [Actinomycetota bacterium]|nr:hypothetical protein [Actinomycetota bacterium]
RVARATTCNSGWGAEAAALHTAPVHPRVRASPRPPATLDRTPSEHEKGRERSHRDASIENPVAPVRGGRGVEVSTGLRRRGYHGGTLAIARSRGMMLA